VRQLNIELLNEESEQFVVQLSNTFQMMNQDLDPPRLENQAQDVMILMIDVARLR